MMKMKKMWPLLAALFLVACEKKAGPPAVGEPADAAAVAVADAPTAAEDDSRQRQPVDPAVIRMMELLRAVYGTQGAGDTYMEVDMPDPEQRSVKARHYLTPVAMHELPDGRVALVANAEVMDDNGQVMSGQPTPGLMSAYVLRKVDGKWLVEAKHENVAGLGSNGRFHDVEWVSLGEGRPGFIVRHGGSWQGFSMRMLSVFDLADTSMRDLTGDGVSLYSDNEGACLDEHEHCWSVQGKWQFEKREGASYDDLVLRFTGRDEKRAEGAPESAARKRKDVAGMARYQFDGKRYVLIEGENIVPEV